MIQPAIEVVQKDRFLISDLIKLRHELESLSDSLARIETKDLLNYFITMMRYRPLQKMLPQSWDKLNAQHFERLIALFDPNLTGKVPMNHLFTLICLQNTPIPDELTLEDYKQRLEGAGSKGKINSEAFTSLPAFFDASQEQKRQYERSNKFNRVLHLKRILFEANCDTKKVGFSDQKLLEIGTFMNILACRSLARVNRKAATYFEALFPASN